MSAPVAHRLTDSRLRRYKTTKVAKFMDLSRIDAVLFDLDGTLYSQPRLRTLMALELATMPLVNPRRARRRLTALRAYRRAQEGLRSHAGSVTAGAQLDAAARTSGLSLTEVAELVDDWMLNRPLKYLQFCRARGLDRLLEVITTRRLRAGVLSDYPAHDKLRALGLDGRFAPILCGTDPDIAALKPHPRGFLHACAIWNLPPERVLYVGDRPDVDAVGATAAGMPCVIIGRSRASDDAGCERLPSLEAFAAHLAD
jgi:phosphoglycolate phosphatase/putative hydrolase of the HAD superfamily